jgi:dimethylaniline monooxygenase (N-oxide forming)
VTGLAAVKNLVEQGFEVEAFERSQHIGGLWRYNEDKDMLSVLKSELDS